MVEYGGNLGGELILYCRLQPPGTEAVGRAPWQMESGYDCAGGAVATS